MPRLPDMTASPEVRAMRLEDLAAVCDLSSQLGYPTSPDPMRLRFVRLLERPEQGLFVATVADALAGWMHVQAQHPLESEPYVEITGLVVGAEHRRRGVGRALVERARRWTRDLRYERLRVRSNVSRAEAHDFYPALGFRVTKTQHVYSLDVGE